MSPVHSTVRIDDIAAGGAGVGRLPDGRAVFVQRTAPGDEARIEIVKEKKRWASGRLLRVLSPGPERRHAPCPHYLRCGGCTLEHLHYNAQLGIKAQIVRETLRRIGGITIETPNVSPSPREFHYRNRVSFTLVRTPNGRVLAGFHDIDRPDRVVDISAACLLPEEALAGAWGELRAGWGENAAYLPSGERLRVTLRASQAGEIALVLEGGFSSGQPDRLMEAVPALRSIWQKPQGAAEYRLLAGQAAQAETWSEEELEVSGAMFLQVNRTAASQLEEYVLSRALAGSPRTVVDGYCGVGLHARRLARLGCTVTGIELDAAAIEEARRAVPAGATFVAARVEDALADALPADLIIVNPPRTGLDPRVTRILAEQKAPHILYVSCDPATLARDLSALAATHTMASVQCFDLFPQTTHVETIVELKCATM